jgi:hypothetical protein
MRTMLTLAYSRVVGSAIIMAGVAGACLPARCQETNAPGSIEGWETLGQLGPFCVYASTNGNARDYLITRRQQPVYWVEEKDGKVEISHFERGLGVLHTIMDDKGNVCERDVSNYDVATCHTVYSYVDRDGDGLWDCMMEHNKRKTWVRKMDVDSSFQFELKTAKGTNASSGQTQWGRRFTSRPATNHLCDE